MRNRRLQLFIEKRKWPKVLAELQRLVKRIRSKARRSTRTPGGGIPASVVMYLIGEMPRYISKESKCLKKFCCKILKDHGRYDLTTYFEDEEDPEEIAPANTDAAVVLASEGSSNVAGPLSPTEKPKRFEIKRWNAVALWAWDIVLDYCPLCRNLVMDQCLECQVYECADCVGVQGACNHAFHFHCMNRWLKAREVCPLDEIPWETKKILY